MVAECTVCPEERRTKLKRQQNLHWGDTNFAGFGCMNKSSPVFLSPIPCLLIIQHVIRCYKYLSQAVSSLYKFKVVNSFNGFPLVIQRNGTKTTCSKEKVLEFLQKYQSIEKEVGISFFQRWLGLRFGVLLLYVLFGLFI